MSRRNDYRLGDHYVSCDTCGFRWHMSQMIEQDVYTGKGGTIVCPPCSDAIDYGIVPYIVPAEEPVEVVRDTFNTGNMSAIPQEYATFNAGYADPMSVTPDTWLQFAENGANWEAITTNWENILTNWESPIYPTPPGGATVYPDGTLGFPGFPSND